MKPFRFEKYTPPDTFGPMISVAREDIVAIEQAHFILSGSRAGNWRTLIHLRGGSTLLVDNSFGEVEKLIYEESRDESYSK